MARFGSVWCGVVICRHLAIYFVWRVIFEGEADGLVGDVLRVCGRYVHEYKGSDDGYLFHSYILHYPVLFTKREVLYKGR